MVHVPGICIKLKWNVTYKNEVTAILTFKCQGHIGISLIIILYQWYAVQSQAFFWWFVLPHYI
jgi:hypothetical protein